MTTNSTTPNNSPGLLEQYQSQIVQMLFGIILTLCNTYIQMLVNHALEWITAKSMEVQNSYLVDIQELHALSLKYATGIISIDTTTFMMNLGLINKLNSYEQVQVPDQLRSGFGSLKMVLPKAIGANIANQVCMVTVTDPILSFTIPYYDKPITIDITKNLASQNGVGIVIKGQYIYVMDPIYQRTYVLKYANKAIPWFFLRDDKYNVSFEMTSNLVMAGNQAIKAVMVEAGSVMLEARVKSELDPLNVVY